MYRVPTHAYIRIRKTREGEGGDGKVQRGGGGGGVKNKNAARHRTLHGRSQKLFETTPRAEEAPAIWYRWNATVGTKKTKQIFMSPPFPPPSPPPLRIAVQIQAAHFSAEALGIT